MCQVSDEYQGNIFEAISPLQCGGLLAFASGFILMGITTAEIYYSTGNSKAFMMGSIIWIFSFTVLRGYFSYLGVPIGSAPRVFIFSANCFIPIWDCGGTKLWVAYPIIVWLIGFGSYLVGNAPNKEWVKSRNS